MARPMKQRGRIALAGAGLLVSLFASAALGADAVTTDTASAESPDGAAMRVYRDPQVAADIWGGALEPDTWCPQPLANKLAAMDVNAGVADIRARFNSSVGSTCPLPLSFYYGLDANPAARGT